MLMVIEEVEEEKTRWGVSFAGSNPEAHEYVECASKEDAWRLKGLVEELLKNELPHPAKERAPKSPLAKTDSWGAAKRFLRSMYPERWKS